MRCLIDVKRVIFIEDERLWAKCCMPNLAILWTTVSLIVASLSLTSHSNVIVKIFTKKFSPSYHSSDRWVMELGNFQAQISSIFSWTLDSNFLFIRIGFKIPKVSRWSTRWSRTSSSTYICNLNIGSSLNIWPKLTQKSLFSLLILTLNQFFLTFKSISNNFPYEWKFKYTYAIRKYDAL